MPDKNNSNTVISILRQKIISGEFPAGKRLAEIPTAESLGVSRTPIRIAFRDLEQEGLLEKLPKRGYLVRKITQSTIRDGVELRGTLEGLAVRQAIEKGITEDCIRELSECLKQGDDIFNKGHLISDDIAIYQAMNHRFHKIIVEASQNKAIGNALSLNEHLPFASVNAIAYNPNQLEQEFRRLQFAHMQHHYIVEAIQNSQAARAEALMKEHAHATISHAELFNEDYVLIKSE